MLQHDVDAGAARFLRPVRDRVGDGAGRAADDAADRDHVLPARLCPVRERGVGGPAQVLLGRDVARREQVLRGDAVEPAEEGLDVRPRLADRLLVGVCDVGDHDDDQIVRRDGSPALLGEPAHPPERLQLGRDRREDERVAEPVLDGELDGLAAAGADDEELRIRLLEGLRPGIEEAVGVEVAVVAHWRLLRPRLEQDVERLAEAGAAGGRVDRAGVRPVLHAGAEREGELHPSTGHDVEHRVLLGQAVRVGQVDRDARDHDLRARRGGRDRRSHQADRGGHAVERVVVLVDADAVEAEVL